MRRQTLVIVVSLGFVLPVLGAGGDWYTGAGAGSFTGTKAPCSCGTIPGLLEYEGFEASAGPGTKLTMEGEIKIGWDGERYPVCQNTQVPGDWELKMEFFREGGACDNNELYYEVNTDVSCSGIAHQMNPLDSQWWWNSKAEIKVDSIKVWYATSIGGPWTEVPDSQTTSAGNSVADMRAAGEDAGNPYGIGPLGEQGDPFNVYSGGDTLNNRPPNPPYYPWPHSTTAITFPPVDPETDTREKWRIVLWQPPVEARHLKLEVQLSGVGGGTHGDNCVVDNDQLLLDLKVEAEMRDI